MPITAAIPPRTVQTRAERSPNNPPELLFNTPPLHHGGEAYHVRWLPFKSLVESTTGRVGWRVSITALHSNDPTHRDVQWRAEAGACTPNSGHCSASGAL